MKRVIAYKLLNSSPEEVCKIIWNHHNYLFLKSMTATSNLFIERLKKFESYDYKDVDISEVEPILLKRDDPLINLSLAQFSSNLKVIDKLFFSNDKTYRLACLSNPFFNPWSNKEAADLYGFTDSFLSSLSKNEIKILIRSVKGSLAKYLFWKLYRKNGIFDNLEENTWKEYILESSENEFLYDNIYCGRDFSPSGPDSHHVGDAALGLFEKIQNPDPVWAYALTQILKKISRAENELDHLQAKSVIHRWRGEKSFVNDVYQGTGSYFDDDDLEYQELRTIVLTKFTRASLDRDIILKIEERKKDPAIRYAFYQTFLVCQNEGDYNQLLIEDGRKFVYHSCHNRNLNEWPVSVLASLESDIDEYYDDMMKNEYLKSEFYKRVKCGPIYNRFSYDLYGKINQYEDSFKSLTTTVSVLIILVVLYHVLNYLRIYL